VKVRYYNLRIKNSTVLWHADKTAAITIGQKISAAKKGKSTGPCSPEKAKKISEAKKAKQRKMSDETKGKLSEAKKGKKLTEEHKQSISQGLLKGKEKKVPERLSEEELYESRMQCQTKAREALRGSKRYNNGIKEISAKEHPGEGWVLGRLPRTAEYTENHKKKCSTTRKDTFVVNDGTKNLYIKNGTPIPEGYVIGMAPRKSSK